MVLLQFNINGKEVLYIHLLFFRILIDKNIEIFFLFLSTYRGADNFLNYLSRFL